jgi:hypothetical protein
LIINQKEVRIINDKTKQEFVIPPGGSLGLLALGNIGVRAWKKAKKNGKKLKIKTLKKNKVVVGWDSADWKIIVHQPFFFKIKKS